MKHYSYWYENRGGVESNEFWIDFFRIFRIIFHFRINRITNFRIERISNEFSIGKNLTSPYSWSRIKSNEFRINFHRIFLIFFALLNQSNSKFSNRIERIPIWLHASLQQISFIYDPSKFGQEKLSISISDDSHNNLNFQTPKLLQRSQTRLKISQLAKVQLVSKKIVNWAICYNLDKSVRHETHFILE